MEETSKESEEVDRLSDRMQAEVRALERTFGGSPGKNLPGIVAGAALGLLALKFLARRRRSKHAPRIVAEKARQVREEAGEVVEDIDFKSLALLGALLGLILRLVEVRQLRRL
ncbi:MAG: hypothetical protein ACRDJ5_08980, partial [Actinomycetota bacterium]